MKYYPAFINLKNKKVVIVGGGRVAGRKALSLIKAGADVSVISPAVTARLAKLTASGKLIHIKRKYKKGDLKGAFIVIAGTSSEETNKAISQDAALLTNVIDIPSEGNFIVPSLIRRGPLTIAISTEGASPAISKAIRREMEKLYNAEFARYLRFVESIRKRAIKEISNDKKREKFLKFIASDKIIRTLRGKGFKEVSERISEALEKIG